MTAPTVGARRPGLEDLVERHLPELVLSDESLKTALPGMARDAAESARVAAAVQEVASDHLVLRGDARDLSSLGDRSIHLVVTSPPYWTLKEYNEGNGQLGAIGDYERFVDELGKCGENVIGCWCPADDWSSWSEMSACRGVSTAAMLWYHFTRAFWNRVENWGSTISPPSSGTRSLTPTSKWAEREDS